MTQPDYQLAECKKSATRKRLTKSWKQSKIKHYEEESKETPEAFLKTAGESAESGRMEHKQDVKFQARIKEKFYSWATHWQMRRDLAC